MLLGDLLSDFRRRINDYGEVNYQEFIGDGTTKSFFLQFIPIDSSVGEVYLDGVLTTYYNIDGETGKLQFSDAPAENTVISVFYKTYQVSDRVLLDYLKDAVLDCNIMIGSSFEVSGQNPAYVVNPDPTNIERKLILLFAHYELEVNRMVAEAGEYYSWRTADIAVNKANITRDRLAALDKLRQEINSLINYINMNISFNPYILSGGFKPLEAGSFPDKVAIIESGRIWLSDLL